MAENQHKNPLKNTKQRQKILEILSSAPMPFTAEEIYSKAREDFPSIALTTIYRNLDALAANQMVSKLMYSDATARYEYIAGEHKHSHFLICVDCKKAQPLEACPIQMLEDGIQEETGFQVTGHNLEIYGYCKECRKKHTGVLECEKGEVRT